MAFMVRMVPVTPVREIFIIAGESNPSGRGNLGQLPTFDYQYKVKNYANDGTWKAAVEPIDSNSGQVDSVSSDSIAAASPALAFGNKLSEFRPYNEIGLVPCAKGATTMANWTKSGLSRSTLYGSMVARALEAKAAGELKGVFWWLGWNDAENSSAASNMATNLLSMFTSLRTDVSEPDLKSVVIGLQDGHTATYRDTINSQLASLDGELSGDIAFVSAAGVPVIAGDTVHVATAGLVTLGEAAAVAMQGLLS